MQKASSGPCPGGRCYILPLIVRFLLEIRATVWLNTSPLSSALWVTWTRAASVCRLINIHCFDISEYQWQSDQARNYSQLLLLAFTLKGLEKRLCFLLVFHNPVLLSLASRSSSEQTMNTQASFPFYLLTLQRESMQNVICLPYRSILGGSEWRHRTGRRWAVGGGEPVTVVTGRRVVQPTPAAATSRQVDLSHRTTPQVRLTRRDESQRGPHRLIL